MAHRRAPRIFLSITLALAFWALILILVTPAPIPRIESAGPPVFALDAVARGEELAKLGNCSACHTSPGGRAYAGGLPIRTSFGTLYSTNITPDPSGLGGWPYEAFRRAMTEGISRDGRYLYPAFPFDHFRALKETDLQDLFAFVMTRAPVTATAPPNRLIWPLGFRPLLAGWRLLFLPREKPDGDESRGRYLVDALAHCGACHTPHNALGGEERKHEFEGGFSAGWYAPPLNAANPAPRIWSEDDLFAYLKTGLSVHHAAAAGPMGEVVHSLAGASDPDVRAIAGYVVSLLPEEDRPRPPPASPPAGEGAALFAGACAACHGEGAPMMQFGRPPLAWGTPLYESTPRDVMAIVLRGLKPPAGPAGPYMPAYAQTLSDAEVASLAAYLRARFTGEPPWRGDLTAEARKAREETAP